MIFDAIRWFRFKVEANALVGMSTFQAISPVNSSDFNGKTGRFVRIEFAFMSIEDFEETSRFTISSSPSGHE